MQYSTRVKNARLDVVEGTIGASAILKIRTGAAPANCAAADAGTVLATIALPANWMADAAGGSKAKSGTWTDLSADAGGTAAHYRIYAADGVTCDIQGPVSLAGGGGDIILDSVVIVAGQEVTIASYTLNGGN